MNEKKFTTAKDDIGSTGVCIWNEHLFFEPKNVVRLFIYLYNDMNNRKLKISNKLRFQLNF